MKKHLLTCILSCVTFILFAQKNPPKFLSWQDHYAKKNITKYFKHDTLIQLSHSTVHISYNNSPNKPYLLLLHGMGMNGRTNWSSQFKTLSKHYNLILPDLIYFGESTSTTKDYSVEFQVEQIREAILKLDITSKLTIMGFSYGGLVSAMYNQLYSSEINKLIIIDGPVKFYSKQTADSMANLVGITTINNLIVPSTIDEFDGMKKAVLSTSFPMSKKLKQKILTHIFLPTKSVRDAQMNYLADHQPHYQNLNYNINNTPTLLIWGKKDGAVPVMVGQKLHQAFPNTTQLLLFKKAKHDAHFRESKKLNKAVIKFINE